MTPPQRPPTAWRLLAASLTFHGRMNLALALGVAAGTAVLTGALLVGDSVRGSLRHLTLDRLGPIDEALVTDRFFRTQLAADIAKPQAFAERFGSAMPAILLEASIAEPDKGARANRVTLLGGDDAFWKISSIPAPKDGEIVLNHPLADGLQAKVGGEVLVRLPTPSEVPRDSALGRKTETVTTRRLKVSAIVPASGMGSFGLRPNQAVSRNAFASLSTLQDVLRQGDRANVIFVTGKQTDADPQPADHDVLQKLLHPQLVDFGLHVKPNSRGYFNLTSDRMLLDDEAEASAIVAFGPREPQPVFTYLANTIAVGERETPYSTVASIDFRGSEPLGPWRNAEDAVIQRLEDDEIVLNQWVADDLEAKEGDDVTLTYFLPESTHGEAREATASFKLRAICKLEGAAADRDLTPTLPGVTDQLSIADWNPPFPFDSSRVRKKDEAYWDDYRATPKAFISLKRGRDLFGSRFGDTTSIRVLPIEGETVDDATAEKLAAEWKPDPVESGFVFQPVKQQGLAASGGTTPFNLLFLGFSMFVIAAAAMLVALLFRLNVETRAREIGILRSVGFSAAKVRRLLLAEGAIVAALGGLLGLAVGVGYAWLMIAGLRTWWVSAISTPFLTLHMTAASYAIGYLAGLLIALGAIVWGLWQTRHVALRRLLAGEASDSAETGRSRTLVSRTVASVSLMLAVVTSLSAFKLSGEAQAGAFFGAGALVLTAALSFIWSQMRRASIGSLVGSGTGALAKLAARNAARHPSRSTLTVGLVASVSFIILAISAFQLQAPTTTDDRATGTGGFALVAESNQPIYQNLNSDDGRYDLGFRKSDDAAFLDAHAHVYAFRVYAGDDASCLNLYQPRQPRVLGVPDSFVERGGFAWGATALEADNRHPWNLLEDLPGDDYVVPVVLDYATAVYSLHLSGKPMEKFTITDGRGEKMTLMIVGLLQNSVFQGSLLISEQAFLRRFPDVSGYRFFLVDAPRDKAATVQGALDRALGDYGFDAEPASDRLAGYLAVQNTYLETFQSLGGLGLLLGTFGLATVQLRNVLERRGELALLRAVGFRRATLGILVMLENACLLVGGLAVGALAAIVALVPHLVGATEASIPWRTSAIMLSAIFVVGMLVGSVAVRAALRTPILSALREE